MKNAPEKPKISTNLSGLVYTLAFQNYSEYSLPLSQKSFTDWLNGESNPYMGYSLVSLMEDPIEHYEILKIRYDK